LMTSRTLKIIPSSGFIWPSYQIEKLEDAMPRLRILHLPFHLDSGLCVSYEGLYPSLAYDKVDFNIFDLSSPQKMQLYLPQLQELEFRVIFGALTKRKSRAKREESYLPNFLSDEYMNEPLNFFSGFTRLKTLSFRIEFPYLKAGRVIDKETTEDHVDEFLSVLFRRIPEESFLDSLQVIRVLLLPIDIREIPTRCTMNTTMNYAFYDARDAWQSAMLRICDRDELQELHRENQCSLKVYGDVEETEEHDIEEPLREKTVLESRRRK